MSKRRAFSTILILVVVIFAVIAVSFFNAELRDQHEKAKHFLEMVETLDSSLACCGQATSAATVRGQIKVLDSLGGQMVDHLQATKIYARISRIVGARASVQTKFDGMKAGLLTLAAGADDDFAVDVGVNYCWVNEAAESGAVGEQSDGLDDIAWRITFNVGGQLSERQLRFLAHQKDKKAALKLIAASYYSHEGIDTLEKLERDAVDPLHSH